MIKHGMSGALKRLEEEGRPIRIGVVGIGQMGRALTVQTVKLPGIRPCVLVDHQPARARRILLEAGVPEGDILETCRAGEAMAALEAGRTVISGDDTLPARVGMLDVVVDATGSPEDGARIAAGAIGAGKHVVSLNVESDIVVGPLLAKMAREAGVVYTGSAGDEPAAVVELYDFACSMGLTPLVLGKGKNNPVNREATPETAAEAARASGMNPRMLASFQDGTKTMAEMTAMANATGFLPDCPGGHGACGGVDDLVDLYRLKSQGGILNGYGVVDYVNGVAPGVVLIYTPPARELREELRDLSQGPGPNYLLFRPYHLTSLETPRTILRLALSGEASIIPRSGAPYAETAAVAKRDLRAGEYLDGIGGCTVYGTILTYQEARARDALPIGLVNGRTRMRRDAAKGELITREMVELDEESFLLRLWREQEKLLAAGQL